MGALPAGRTRRRRLHNLLESKTDAAQAYNQASLSHLQKTGTEQYS